jgi:hypothetical protein
MTKTVPLRSPILWHDAQVRELEFREPRWKDHEELGEVDGWMRAPDGTVSRMNYPAIVAQYARRCIAKPDDASILELLPLRETLAVHEAVAGFFTEARATEAPTGG